MEKWGLRTKFRQPFLFVVQATLLICLALTDTITYSSVAKWQTKPLSFLFLFLIYLFYIILSRKRITIGENFSMT